MASRPSWRGYLKLSLVQHPFNVPLRLERQPLGHPAAGEQVLG